MSNWRRLRGTGKSIQLPESILAAFCAFWLLLVRLAICASIVRLSDDSDHVPRHHNRLKKNRKKKAKHLHHFVLVLHVRNKKKTRNKLLLKRRAPATPNTHQEKKKRIEREKLISECTPFECCRERKKNLAFIFIKPTGCIQEPACLPQSFSASNIPPREIRQRITP